MKAQRRKELLATRAFVVAAAAALGAGVVFARKASSARQRTFEFTCQVRVPATVGSKREGLAIESRVAHEVGEKPEFGNSYAVFHPTPEQAAAGYAIALRFEVVRTWKRMARR